MNDKEHNYVLVRAPNECGPDIYVVSGEIDRGTDKEICKALLVNPESDEFGQEYEWDLDTKKGLLCCTDSFELCIYSEDEVSRFFSNSAIAKREIKKVLYREFVGGDSDTITQFLSEPGAFREEIEDTLYNHFTKTLAATKKAD